MMNEEKSPLQMLPCAFVSHNPINSAAIQLQWRGSTHPSDCHVLHEPTATAANGSALLAVCVAHRRSRPLSSVSLVRQQVIETVNAIHSPQPSRPTDSFALARTLTTVCKFFINKLYVLAELDWSPRTDDKEHLYVTHAATRSHSAGPCLCTVNDNCRQAEY